MRIQPIAANNSFRGKMNIDADKDTLKAIKIGSKAGGTYRDIEMGISRLNTIIEEKTPQDALYTLSMSFDSNERAYLNIALKNNSKDSILGTQIPIAQKGDVVENFKAIEDGIDKKTQVDTSSYDENLGNELKEILETQTQGRNFKIESSFEDNRADYNKENDYLITVTDLGSGEVYSEKQCIPFEERCYGYLSCYPRPQSHQGAIDSLAGKILAPQRIEQTKSKNAYNMNNGKIIVSNESLKNLQEAYELSRNAQEPIEYGIGEMARKLNCETSPYDQFEIVISKPEYKEYIKGADERYSPRDRYSIMNYTILNRSTMKEFQNSVNIRLNHLENGNFIPKRIDINDSINTEFEKNLEDYAEFEKLAQMTGDVKLSISNDSIEALRSLRNCDGNFKNDKDNLRDIYRALVGNIFSLSQRLEEQTPDNKRYQIHVSDIYDNGILLIALEDLDEDKLCARRCDCNGWESYYGWKSNSDSYLVWSEIFKPISDEMGLKY